MSNYEIIPAEANEHLSVKNDDAMSSDHWHSLRHLLYSLTSVVVIDDVRDVFPVIEVPLVT